MREIKFRAFDTVNKKYVPQGEVVFKDYGDTSISVIPNCQEYIYVEVKPEQFVIEQFTGLTDKNGKEIYEGDILACYDWGTTNTFMHNDVILWDVDENGWNFKTDWAECRYDFRKAIIVSEVIGNIHENPELL